MLTEELGAWKYRVPKFPLQETSQYVSWKRLQSLHPTYNQHAESEEGESHG